MNTLGPTLGCALVLLVGCSAGVQTSSAAKALQAPTSEEERALDRPGLLHVGGATLTIVYEGGDPPLPKPVIDAWVRRCAEMVAEYLGGFPVPSLEITMLRRGRGGVVFGTHQDGRWIRMFLGEGATQRSLDRDWILIHELLHAAFPDLDREHRWMQEGLSTYLEPGVRTRKGDMTEAQLWAKWVDRMDYGRPQSGDRGLDRTHTWGRTYWGGALFWLLVDVELRAETNNRSSLRDAIRGVLAAGGNGREAWSTARVAEVCDETTQTEVLSRLYARMAQAPGDVDLDALWEKLGVVPDDDGEVSFDDDAPWAHVRRGITQDSAPTTRAPISAHERMSDDPPDL